MESIFFRRLEPRRSTQSLLPVNVTGLGGFENINPSGGVMPLDLMNPQYTTQAYTVQSYNKVLGSCPWIDSPGLQSVVGTMGDMFGGRGSFGQYNVGTTSWGGYNAGVGVSSKVLGSCPWIDSPGLQSVVGTMGDIYSGVSSPFSSRYNLSNTSTAASFNNFSDLLGCRDFGYCRYIGGGCSYIGGGGCLFVDGGCLLVGGGCSFFGGCMVIDPAPYTSIIGTLDSFRQY